MIFNLLRAIPSLNYNTDINSKEPYLNCMTDYHFVLFRSINTEILIDIFQIY